MVKRGHRIKFLIIALTLFLLIAFPLISAGFFGDIYDKITGRASQDTTSLNVTIGNSAPTIDWVESVSSQNPTDDTTTSITFNFTATDTDGAVNIDGDTGKAYFQRAGETTRSNTSCVNYSSSGDDVNFTCTIDMWYFDENGAWTINVTAQDINSASAENSSTTLTYNSLPGMKMSPTSLEWAAVGLSDTDTSADNNPIQINNTGNDVSLSINVSSYDLQGEETDTEYIYANNFTVENKTTGCSGTAMVNESSINVTSAILQRGNHSLNYNNATSGQEQIYFCLKGVPQDISSQSYSSTAFGAWTIEIVS